MTPSTDEELTTQVTDIISHLDDPSTDEDIEDFLSTLHEDD